jgi:hypothetical protein
MTKRKTLTNLAGAVALAFAIAAAPAVFSQQDDRPMGDQHQHMHGQAGEMPEGHAEMMAEHQAQMAEHKAAMEAHMARMDELIAEMNQATGDAKVDAVAAVINEMWSQHEAMREHMGMMGGMAMMGGHSGCCMQGGGECPLMKEKMNETDEMQGMDGHEGDHGN